MTDLYNSQGKHIAILEGDDLYTPTGEPIGFYEFREQVFISMDGYYLGEVFDDSYLVYDRSSPHRGVRFPLPSRPPRWPDERHTASIARANLPSGFEDVQLPPS